MMGREDIPTLFQAPKDAAAAIGNPYGPGAQKAEIQPRNIESQGAADISSGIARTTRGTGNDVAGGISQAVRGAGSMAAPVAIPIGLATAPIQTIAGLAGGTLGAGVTHAALKHTNIPQGYKDLAEDAGGLVGGGLGAGVGSKVSPSITNAVMHPMETLTGINDNAPEVLLSKSLRGSVPAGKPKFQSNLSTSMPEIKAVEPQLGKPIETIDDLLGTDQQPGAVRIAKRNIIDQYKQLLDSQGQMGKQINLSPVADAMDRSVSRKTQLENPQVARKINVIANRYRQPFEIEDVDKLLHDTNAELNSYYLKNPVAQRVAASANPDTAMLDAQAKALRDSLYKAMDDPGGGVAAKELMRRYGTLMELEDSLYKRRNVALRQAPLDLSQNISKWESLGDMAKGAAKLLTGQVSGAADIASGLTKSKVANWLKDQQTTDALIKRAFANHTTPPSPIQMPPRVVPAGLLGPAATQMPGVPDASGPVPGGPYMGRGMSPSIGTRTLGPGPRVTPMPSAPDTSGPVPGGPYPNSGIAMPAGNRTLPPASMHQSGGFATGTTNDLVPIVHPVTGQIEYVPEWMVQAPHVVENLPPGTHTFRNGAVIHKDAAGRSRIVKPPDESQPQPSQPQQAQHSPSFSPTAQSILDTMGNLGAEQDVPISVSSIRKSMPNVGKNDFDRAVMELHAARKVYGSTHDHPLQLSDQDRNNWLVDTGQIGDTYSHPVNRHFVALSLR